MYGTFTKIVQINPNVSKILYMDGMGTVVFERFLELWRDIWIISVLPWGRSNAEDTVVTIFEMSSIYTTTRAWFSDPKQTRPAFSDSFGPQSPAHRFGNKLPVCAVFVFGAGSFSFRSWPHIFSPRITPLRSHCTRKKDYNSGLYNGKYQMSPPEEVAQDRPESGMCILDEQMIHRMRNDEYFEDGMRMGSERMILAVDGHLMQSIVWNCHTDRINPGPLQKAFLLGGRFYPWFSHVLRMTTQLE